MFVPFHNRSVPALRLPPPFRNPIAVVAPAPHRMMRWLHILVGSFVLLQFICKLNLIFAVAATNYNKVSRPWFLLVASSWRVRVAWVWVYLADHAPTTSIFSRARHRTRPARHIIIDYPPQKNKSKSPGFHAITCACMHACARMTTSNMTCMHCKTNQANNVQLFVS